jgi:hypothetical protein
MNAILDGMAIVTYAMTALVMTLAGLVISGALFQFLFYGSLSLFATLGLGAYTSWWADLARVGVYIAMLVGTVILHVVARSRVKKRELLDLSC